jgi:hypothetical protein
LPRVVLSDRVPQILTPAKNYLTIGTPMPPLPPSRTSRLKAIVDKKSNEILGVALLAPESYEVINIVKLAMDHHLPSTSLRDMVFTHPTMAESLNDLFAF